MPATGHLQLPLLSAAQAQKHVTHNEALLMLDGLVQLSVLDRTHAAPPSSPADGARYLIAASATGAWAGKDGQIAFLQDAAWRYLVPDEGWLVFVAAERHMLVFHSGAWTDLKVRSAETLGINATPDSGHPLAVAGDGTLLTAATSDHRLTVNKASTGATASLLFQKAYSGRAEIGLAGDDDLSVKTSSDGSSWSETMRFATDRIIAGAPIRLRNSTVAALPSASGAGAGALIYVSDASGGAVPAFSDGSSWRSVADRAVIS
ncbi:DUF2793 domain-containing protein [Terrarubrum flagellatum]|uniref:DUF2793 domain-containing protein n=1 Tax=Terrirubrum flagellatum TaxID=2895980 RepID=UPI00314551B8